MPVKVRTLRERKLERARMRWSGQELAEIKTELATLREELKAAVALLEKHQSRIIAAVAFSEKHQSRINAQDNRIELLDQKICGILNGRVWKSLERIGRLPRVLFKR
jgi:hypothetical protein